MRRETGNELPIWLWLIFPPTLIVVQICVRYFDIQQVARLLGGEGGIIENMTVLLLIPAIVLGALIVKNSNKLPSAWMRHWFLVLTLAALYFAGEEASWGQHWFGWATPDTINAINDQGETNFHNTSSWLDQKPRLIVELSALIGGVFIPIFFRFKEIKLLSSDWRYWFFPTLVSLPTAAIVGFIKIPDRIFGTSNIPTLFRVNVSETQEYYVALFFLIYFLSVFIRLRRE